VRESDLYLPMVEGAKADAWRLYRIADGSPGRKPFDIGGFAPGGVGVGLEAKIVRSYPAVSSGIPWAAFAPHQRSWLEDAAAIGGLPLVALYSLEDRGLRIYRLYRGEFDMPSGFLVQVDLRWLPAHKLWRGWPNPKELEKSLLERFTSPE
jgi:hypothetical protein